MKKSEKICIRDNYTCQICGKSIINYVSQGQLDHLIPKSMGGGVGEENLYLTCCECNHKRSNRANFKLMSSIINKLENSLDKFDLKLLKYEISKGGITEKQYKRFVQEFIAITDMFKEQLLKEGE